MTITDGHIKNDLFHKKENNDVKFIKPKSTPESIWFKERIEDLYQGISS